ncbi:MAG: cytochrome c biogenesis protein CcsA [Actinomycetes bacterium]|jgi:cytochrome c-type biogenesis protein CcmF|nr:cytochrome c biogenesis protein CcsA [Actinomycetes bacterium]
MLLLGKAGLWIGFLAALVAVVAFLIGRTPDKAGRQATKAGFYLTLLSTIGMTMAVLVIVVAFFAKDYSFAYVAENHSTDASSLAWLYTLSGLWAGQSGSILFWAWLMTLFSGWLAMKNAHRDDGLPAMALMVMNVIVVIFALLMVMTEGNNPFLATPSEYYVNGQLVGAASQWGMNPLLQHWAMILHPPTLFIGYAGLAIPFAYGLAALIVNETDSGWVKEIDRITVFSWLFLGIGIGLGSVWAYVVLGWGGFWGWDPVENASILPWFVGLGLIHSMTVYRRKGNMKVWTLMLTALTFVMVVVGTFITRSGLVQSVHAFAEDPVARNLFMALMIATLLSMIIGIIVRWNGLKNNTDFEALTGKDAMYFLNNVLMTIASVIILFMTVAPAIIDRTYGANQYEVIARIVGIIYLLVIAVCPALNWGSTDGRTVWQRLRLPLLISLIPFLLLVWEWMVNLRPVYADMVALGGENAEKFSMYGPFLYDVITLLGFFLACFLIVNTLMLFVRGVRARAAGTGTGIPSAVGAVLFKARKQSGGYIAHIALGIIVIGLIGSVMYVRSGAFNVNNEAGTKIQMADYVFTYDHLDSETLTSGDVVSTAVFNVERGGRSIGQIGPSQTQFAVQGQVRLNASVKSEPLRDIFFVFNGMTEETSSTPAVLQIDVKINPLIWFAWTGFGLMMLGTALATWPKKQAVSR